MEHPKAVQMDNRAGGSGIVIARSPGLQGVLLTTSSATNAPVTSSDGTSQIATFKASANLIIADGDLSDVTEFDYLIIAGGGGGGTGGNGGGGAGAGGYRTSFPWWTKNFIKHQDQMQLQLVLVVLLQVVVMVMVLLEMILMFHI